MAYHAIGSLMPVRTNCCRLSSKLFIIDPVRRRREELTHTRAEDLAHHALDENAARLPHSADHTAL